MSLNQKSIVQELSRIVFGRKIKMRNIIPSCTMAFGMKSLNYTMYIPSY